MVDAEAAQAAAQKLADQFAEQGGSEPNGTAADATEPEETLGNKRKLETEDDEIHRKKASLTTTGPKDEKKFVQQPTPAAQGASGEWEQTIEIAKNMVGKLIGKSGETIRNLQSSTGTRIQIDHQAQGEFKKVTLSGSSAENLSGCVRSIESIMTDEPSAGDTSKTLDCPQGIVGRIIGRGGETIRALQQASQAHIVVDQSYPEGQPRKVIISGRPDAVERASKMIDELIHGEPGGAQTIIQRYAAGINRVIECPKSIVGRVIGKQGETIKALQRTYGANIQIDQAQDPMKITIAGQAQSVDHAAAAVREIINGGNPYLGGPGGPGGFGGPGGPGGPFNGPRGGPGGFGGQGGPGFGGGGPGFGGGFPGFGGFPGMVPPQAFGGYPGGFPQPYGQPGAMGYGGFGQDPYAAGTGANGGAASYGAGAASGGAASGYGAPASSIWQELADDQGRTYYYNTQTGASQWEKPE